MVHEQPARAPNMLPVLLGRGMVQSSERSLRFGGPEGGSIHMWEEAMMARKSTYLVPWLVGDRGPGMRLKRARKWHMNRAMRRDLAKERHLEAIAKFYEVARRAAAINPSVSFGEIAWTAI